jgi:hypothetical protein
MKLPVPRKFALTLTSLQLTQMVVGIAVNIYSVYVIGNESSVQQINVI